MDPAVFTPKLRRRRLTWTLCIIVIGILSCWAWLCYLSATGR